MALLINANSTFYGRYTLAYPTCKVSVEAFISFTVRNSGITRDKFEPNRQTYLGGPLETKQRRIYICISMYIIIFFCGYFPTFTLCWKLVVFFLSYPLIDLRWIYIFFNSVGYIWSPLPKRQWCFVHHYYTKYISVLGIRKKISVESVYIACWHGRFSLKL